MALDVKPFKTTEQSNSLDDLFQSTFLRDLLDPPPITEPDKPIKEGERVLGEMNLLERILYSMTRQYEKLASIAGIRAKYDLRGAEREAMIHEIAQLNEKAIVVRQMMWTVIGERFSYPNEETLGVRAGFQIVAFVDKRPASPIASIVSGLIRPD